MKTAYIANVGTRDVQLDGKPLPWPRTEGAELLARYDEVRARLSAPILEPGLRHVLAETERIHRVQLFVSDQPPAPETAEDFWKRDTVELGRILERLLNDLFGSRIEQITCYSIRHNPADYNRSLAFFAEQLSRLLPPDELDALYIAPIGGVDASNVGLTLNAVRAYRKKCQFIYVFPGGKVQALDLHREILADYARQEIRLHLANRDFVALRHTLDSAELGRTWLQSLCVYADCRLRFDFGAAREALDQALAKANDAQARVRIQRCRDSLLPLLNDKHTAQPTSVASEELWEEWLALQRARLRELYFNLRLKVQRAEWVDFLGRLFRLYEATLRLLFEQETRHSTEKESQAYPDFIKHVEANSELTDHYNEENASYREPNTHVLFVWLGFQVRRDGRRYGPFHRHLQTIRGLSELRNKSIMAHGYEGIGRERIESHLKEQTINGFVDKELRQLLIQLGISEAEMVDPFDVLTEWLQEV